MELQSIVRNEFINEHSLWPSAAVANKWNEVLVMYSANCIDFRLKLTIPLPTSSFELLDGYFLPIWKNSLVHIPESTLSEEIGIWEAIRRQC